MFLLPLPEIVRICSLVGPSVPIIIVTTKQFNLSCLLKRILLLYIDMVNPDEEILLEINCIALR